MSAKLHKPGPFVSPEMEQGQTRLRTDRATYLSGEPWTQEPPMRCPLLVVKAVPEKGAVWAWTWFGEN